VTALSLPQIVDLDRYPIDRLDEPEGRRLVERARAALHAVGACDLPAFLRPEATAAAVESALSLHGEAFRTDQTHDIEFSGLPPESLARDDPRRVRIRSAKEGTAFDEIPEDSPVRRLYESDELLRFVAAALELEPLFRSDDPLGALNYMYYLPGDELGWHFDNADFVVTLMLQAPEAGGAFEFAPMLRSAGDRNDDGVRSLLAGDRDLIRTMSGAAGTLALFRGHWSPHRVTPVEGALMRVNAVLSYAGAPGHRLGDETYRLFYGRVPAQKR
jgi:hypothetical protein